MRAISLAALSILVLTATPSLAASCRDEVRHTQAEVNHLRPGPNTSAANHHLRAARASRSTDRCYREVAEARRYADRSRELDRRISSQY
jgi:hypothetical protein